MDKNQKFGFSFSGVKNLTELPPGIVADNLKYIEINGEEMLNFYETFKNFRRRTFAVRDIINPITTRSVWEATAAIKADFYNHFNTLSGRSLRQGCRFITLDLDLTVNYAPENDQRERLLRSFKGLYRGLMENNLILLMPLRFPAADSRDTWGITRRFLFDSLNDRVKIVLDVHPHEISDPVKVREILQKIKMQLRMIRLVYEPETGNRIIKPHIEMCLNHSIVYPSAVPFLFAPQLRNGNAAIAEIEYLNQLAGDFVKSSISPHLEEEKNV